MNYFKFLVLSLTLFVIGVTNSNAQVFEPVKWEYKSENLGNNEFELQFIATIEAHWHLYSQHIKEDGPNGSPIPTGFFFTESDEYIKLGATTEPKGTTINDPIFQMELKYFSDKAVFKQKVKLTGESATITGELEFMSCDDEKCLPPELLEFEFNLTGEKLSSKKKEEPVTETKAAEPITITMGNPPANQPDNMGVMTPVTWKTNVIDLGNREYELQAIATIEDHWHLYSVNLPRADGPIATEFNILDTAGVETIGEVVEDGDLLEEFDPNFDMELRYFSNTVTLKQKVKINTPDLTIKAETYFMSCNEETCIPPEAIELEFVIGKGGAISSSSTSEPQPTITEHKTGEQEEKRSMLSIIILSFMGGLAALLTPCVFPMIPMTVSFFTKQSKTKADGVKNALIYGASIIAIYVTLGVGVSAIFGADRLNEMATGVWFNLFFFVLLVIFAISFLGAFEITLPSSWVNKADSKVDQGGLIGIFFMAFVLALVSFSCTGPIIGTLLVEAASSGGKIGPIIGMLSFSTALALPFALFAMFPGWMNSLPKSGGWLNTVKVVLGFLELALAFKFLQNADYVLEAGYITREVFLGIWIVVFFALTVYLFGWIRLPHDSPLEGISVGRLLLALVVGWFTIYMIPGMWGAPLKLISAFPPPPFYAESPNGVGFQPVFSAGITQEIPKGADPSHCPHNLNCFHDYDEGLAYAKEVNKPVMVDFTGLACVNCRKMEQNVWSDPAVLTQLRNDFVIISLYVDKKQELPESEQYISKTGKKIKTIGNKWSDKQIQEYGTNAQPYYVILDHNEKQLHEHAAYDPDIPKFVDWLERGKKLFEEKK